jgi:hypothetical protein
VRITADKVLHGATPSAGGVQPRDKAISKAAKELGIDKSTVSRAIAAESLDPEVKAAANDPGLGTVKRAELSVLERSEHIAEWIKLSDLQSAQLAPIESKRSDGRGHRQEGGINAATRELGIDRTEAPATVKNWLGKNQSIGNFLANSRWLFDQHQLPGCAPGGKFLLPGFHFLFASVRSVAKVFLLVAGSCRFSGEKWKPFLRLQPSFTSGSRNPRPAWGWGRTRDP